MHGEHCFSALRPLRCSYSSALCSSCGDTKGPRQPQRGPMLDLLAIAWITETSQVHHLVLRCGWHNHVFTHDGDLCATIDAGADALFVLIETSAMLLQ